MHESTVAVRVYVYKLMSAVVAPYIWIFPPVDDVVVDKLKKVCEGLEVLKLKVTMFSHAGV